jgi:chromosomal replication initiation ATPase DnaA
MNTRTTVEILGVKVYIPAAPAPCAPLKWQPSPGARAGGLAAILDSCSAAFGFTVHELAGPSHSRALVAARREFAREARRQGYSFPEIGRALGRHHTTIMHLVK